MTLFRITRNIWQGPFASRKRLPELQRQTITHIVNVGESPPQLDLADGPFSAVNWVPIEDLVLIPVDAALQCIDALHHAVCAADSNVYIHCVAGWNRSPTVLALYLMACGIDRDEACDRIARHSYDAVPLHSQLVNDDLVRHVRQYGLDNFTPHPRLEALDAPTVA